MNRIEQDRTEQDRTEQNRTEQNRAEQNRAERSGAVQSRAEQSREIIALMWYMGRRIKFFLTPTCEIITNPITWKWFRRVLRLNITPQILSMYSSPLPCVSHSLPISSFLKVFLPNLYAYSSPILCVPHSLPISSFLQVFYRNSVPIVIHSRACHIPCPFHLFRFYHSNNFLRVWKISRPFTMYFFKPFRTVRFSKRIFCSAVFVRCWSLSQGTATEINYVCLHTAFEGWKVRGEVHGLVLIWNTKNFLRD